MNVAKVKAKRNMKQLLNKIKYIEDNFRKSHDFLTTEIGAGLIEEGTFEGEVEKICPHYFSLVEIMADHASAGAPKALRVNLRQSSDEDDLLESNNPDSDNDEIINSFYYDDDDDDDDDDEDERRTHHAHHANSRGSYNSTESRSTGTPINRSAPVNSSVVSSSVIQGSTRSRSSTPTSTKQRKQHNTGESTNVALLDEEATSSIWDLAGMKLAVAECQEKSNALEYKTNKLKKLKALREDYSVLTDGENLIMFPGSLDIIHLNLSKN
eukprot:scaffold22545_cov61-Attheya_sp.AAC.2